MTPSRARRAPRFLVTNSVPVNAGDEALLRGLVSSVQARWPGCEVTVACKELAWARRHLPDLHLVPDLEFAGSCPTTTWGRARRRLLRASRGRAARVAALLPSREVREVMTAYRRADVVISSPGGFLHEHYRLDDRFRGFEMVHEMNTPLLLVGQSIGPFTEEETRARARAVLGRAAAVCVRDDVSYEHLAGLGLPSEVLHRTTDVAFLIPRADRVESGGSRSGAVAVSLRAWPLGSDGEDVVLKGVELAVRLLRSDARRTLLFLSTCQGVPGYVDDSALAERVVGRLPPELAARCRVDRQRHSPGELMQLYGQCEVFVGMRLHGAVLAMLGGTPAAGLGYEPKTREVFGELGLERYQVGFEQPLEEWAACAERVLRDADDLRLSLPARMDAARHRAGQNIDVIADVVEKLSEGAPVGRA